MELLTLFEIAFSTGPGRAEQGMFNVCGGGRLLDGLPVTARPTHPRAGHASTGTGVAEGETGELFRPFARRVPGSQRDTEGAEGLRRA